MEEVRQRRKENVRLKWCEICVVLSRDWSGRNRPPFASTETLHTVRVTIGRRAEVLPYAVIDFQSVGQLIPALHETHARIFDGLSPRL